MTGMSRFWPKADISSTFGIGAIMTFSNASLSGLLVAYLPATTIGLDDTWGKVSDGACNGGPEF